MILRYFSLIAGIMYLLVGASGFIPALLSPPPATAQDLVVANGYGYLMGLFPVNVLHNIVHLLVGVGGIIGYRSVNSARVFARVLAIFYGILTAMGAFPTLNTSFGFIPIFGNDIWLHALTAAIAAYFGFIAPTLEDAGVVKQQ